MAELPAQHPPEDRAVEAADVVVIGSGMGGATTAWALAQRGVQVLLVERGESIPREAENSSPEAVFAQRRYKPSEVWYDGAGRPFAPGIHAVVGGSTKVYGASLPRFREADFGLLEHHEGLSPAWPFTYADLEPYYAEAERLYAVHGTTGEDPTEPWRSSPFPHPPLPHEPYIDELAERLRAAGVHPSANAMGIDWEGDCLRCATCDGFPCPVAAKSDAESRAVRPALATGNVRLLTGVTVRRLSTRNGRVTHAVADGPHGAMELRARKFVLSAGAVLSAALLLTSKDEDHPDGLANTSGLVGRNFMMHNNAHIGAADPRRRNRTTFQKTLSVNDFYLDGGDGFPLGTMQLIGKVQGSMIKTRATRVPRVALDAFAAFSVEWLVMAEDLPHPDNRVTVDTAGRITTTRRAVGTSTHARLLSRTKALLRACGYPVVGVQPFDISMNSHQCGTVVAGADAASSVLDPWCRSHDLENLWVVDGGFFPSSAAMNPALTIAAQALRVVAESDLAT